MNIVKNGDNKFILSRLIRIRGLPWTTTKKEIVHFFSGINILGGVSGIHFIPDDPNMVGVAYVQVTSKKDYDLAKGRHRKNLDGRYIDGKILRILAIIFHLHSEQINIFYGTFSKMPLTLYFYRKCCNIVKLSIFRQRYFCDIYPQS